MGTPGSTGAGSSTTAGDTGGTSATSGSGASSDTGGSALDCQTPHAAVVRLQLLSSSQYTHTVQDLLQATGDPGSALGDNVFEALDDARVEQWADAATAVAHEAATNLSNWAPCRPPTTGDATACEQQIIDKIGRLAFRRPLTSDDTTQMKTLFDAGIKAKDFATGVEWYLTGLLQSPDVMYEIVRPEPSEMAGDVRPLGPYEYATRLAYFIWDSPPDDTLLNAAASNDFADTSKLQAQLDRMMQDDRSTRGIQAFYGRWLNLAAFDELARDDTGFDLSVAQSLSTSLLMSATQLYTSATPNISDLFSGQSYYMNDVLRKFYGLPGTGTAFTPVTMSGENRRGILTHPALMALQSRPAESNPIARGLFIVRTLLCTDVPPPPAGVAIPPLPPPQPGSSTRDRLEEHTTNAPCSTCHRVFDPPGFALENFDEVGRFRTMDQGKSVDTSGTMMTGTDVDGDFATGDELLARLTTSNDVRTCFAKQYLKFALSRDQMDPADACSADALSKAFAPSGDLKELVASVAVTDAFRQRLTEGVGK